MRSARPSRAQRGFSLLEAIIALAILSVGVLSLAQLFPLATNANIAAKESTYATVLAAQKLEELRARAWTFDAAGVPVTDPALLTGEGTDYVDRSGNAVDAADPPPGAAAFVRRWSIVPLPASPEHTVLIEVRVRPHVRHADGVGDRRWPGEARVVTVRTRKAP